ncbi:MAG: helix-turn-helix domain-containing protein [Ilumatobacteraceae bacterium]
MPAPQAPDGRRRRSLRTRARIVEAARQRFVEHGYLATTIESIADAGGVAVQTVYYVFGTKRNVLAAVLDTTIAGDAEPVAVLERPWIERFAAAPDAPSALALLVDGGVEIITRAAPVYEVVRTAAADPEVGALLEGNRRARRADQRRLVEMMVEAGHLRAGLDVDTAADVFYAVVNEEVHRLLVVDCRWELGRFRTWVRAVLSAQLLGEG